MHPNLSSRGFQNIQGVTFNLEEVSDGDQAVGFTYTIEIAGQPRGIRGITYYQATNQELDLMIWRCFNNLMMIFCCLKVVLGPFFWGVDMDAAATIYIRLLQFWKLFSFAKVFPVFRWMRQERCAMSVTCRNPLRNHHRCSRSHEPCGQGSGSFRLPCLSRATVNAASDWSEAKKWQTAGCKGSLWNCRYYIYIRIYILSESRLTGSYCFVLFHDVLFSWHDLHQILQNMCRMHLMIGCYMSSIWFCLYHHEWASVGCHAKSILKAHAWLWMYVSILCKWVRTHSPATVYEHEF